MAYGTMRKAHRQWQALNRRLQVARNNLNHHYLALLHKAEACRIDPQKGLLGAAAALLQQLPDPQTHELQKRLNNAFAILGKGFLRRSPTSLQLDIFRFADQIQKLCQKYNHLAAKLQMAQMVFDAVQHNQSISKQNLNLALINPEIVWVSLLLRQRCRLTRQAIDLSLTRSWQTKQALCQRFCQLLQPLLPPQTFRKLQKSLIEFEDHTTQLDSLPWSPAAQSRLDCCTEMAHQLAAEIISSQSHIK